jgi:excinuclease ABC subunit C
VRDEAHRFAITFHRELRRRARLRSVLDDVPGIGTERRRRLLRHFGSVRRLAQATLDEITAVPGIGPDLAATIFERLRSEKPELAAGTGRLTLKPVATSESGEAHRT